MSGANNNEIRQLERKRLRSWVINAGFTSLLYVGFLLIEALFFGGDMSAAVTTLAVGSPIAIGSILTYYFVPRFRAVPLYYGIAAQLAFLVVGAMINELEFYFFFQLLIAGAVFATKNFKLAAAFEASAILINILALIFYVPCFVWINDFRFFMQFAMYVYGSLIMLAQTHQVVRKEGISNRALAAFTALLHSTPNLMAVTDADGKVLYLSDTMVRFIKCPHKDSAVGRPILDLISDQGLRRVFAGILDTDNLYESITPIDMDGEERYFKIVSDKLTGDTEGIFIDISDITPTIRSNIEAQKAQLAAEEANKSKSNFLAKMSHEIRTPMNAIIGMAEIALREDIPDTVREHIFTIRQAGTNLLSIINDILDFSKIEAGKLEIVPVDYMLTSLLNDAISIIRMRTVDSQVLFVVTVDSSIPDELYGDEVRIRQILLNLLSNAIKFTEKGFISFTVFGEADEDTVTLTISVADSGKGIRPEDIDKLFENFSQVDLERNKGMVGTGLGLAITRSLARAMDGEVSVVSEYGKGSEFTVTLPQKIRSRHPLAVVRSPEEKHVLVYETREIYANSIICTIDNLGVECRSVSTVSELCAEIETGAYNYLFVAASLYEDIRELCGRLADGMKIVLLAGFGEAIASRSLSILIMPAYSTSVANLLNGVAESAMYSENSAAAIRFTAPEASVLIVDDIDTNLLVIQGLLMPYRMKLTFCNSGFSAIEAVAKERFDLIFMDHMMPDMDGIETVRRIRKDPGNRGIPIIALTANAITGAKQMFLEAGFHDYLSKPVDTLKLDAILVKWIPKEKRKKSFPEKDGQTLERARPTDDPQRHAKLLAVFRRDAQKAVAVLRETEASGDIKLFTTTVHAMKSALGAIGEPEKAELALALEKAGRRGDTDYIASCLGGFIELLEAFSRQPPEEKNGKPETDIHEDREFLARQLSALKTACGDYDETAAYEALGLLKEKPWRRETTEALEAIRDTLYLHSDFEEAASLAEILMRKGEA